MIESKSRRLDHGDFFPMLRMHLTDGGSITLPDGVTDGWTVILFYRGHW